jgi:hypothetical protein
LIPLPIVSNTFKAVNTVSSIKIEYTAKVRLEVKYMMINAIFIGVLPALIVSHVWGTQALTKIPKPSQPKISIPIFMCFFLPQSCAENTE